MTAQICPVMLTVKPGKMSTTSLAYNTDNISSFSPMAGIASVQTGGQSPGWLVLA